MIDYIALHQLLPKVFVGTRVGEDLSDIWLRDVQWHRGESILIEAESGRGKTSLCGFISGIRSDYVGSVQYLAADGSQLPLSTSTLLRQHIGVMYQEHRLFAELSAVENIMLKAQLTQFVTETEVRQLLCRLGLSACLDRPCSTLSLGQQQRVAFVRALSMPCSFLLLDEPVSHLDPQNGEVMAQILQERQQKAPLGLIVTSVGHRLEYPYDRILKL